MGKPDAGIYHFRAGASFFMDVDLMESGEQPMRPTALVEQKKAEAASTIQAALVIAKRFPRDQNAAYLRIMESCKRISLAKQAVYKYPRGGEAISGPSIRLAEVLAQAWGNIKYGFQELEQFEGHSVVESFCHDLETNTYVARSITVKHQITLKNKTIKHLTDSRDIYELVANYAQRRVRATILEIIPGDIVEAAVEQCRKTIIAGDTTPIADRIRACLVAFKGFGVSQEMIEAKIGHKIDLTTAEELFDLQGMHNAIRDKQAKRGDFFDFPEDDIAAGQAAELGQKLKEKRAAAPPLVPTVYNIADVETSRTIDGVLKAKKVDEALWGDIKKALNGKPLSKLDDVMKEVFAR